MKKSWLSILSALIITLAASIVSPAPVLADKPNTFTASGTAFVTGVPVMIPDGPRGVHWKVLNEPVDAWGLASDWPALIGANLSTLHKSEVTFFADGTFRGELNGTFSIAASGGTLQGTILGTFTGNWTLGPTGPAILGVSDTGSWSFTGGTGSFAGTKGEGKWAVALTPVLTPLGWTLGGPLSFEGKYRQ